MAIRRWMPVESFQDWTKFEQIEVSPRTHGPVPSQGPQETATIIEEFKKTPYYLDIFNTYKVLAIYVVGSRSINMHTDTSDLDMIVILDEKRSLFNVRPIARLAYKGIPVHYNMYSYEELFHFEDFTKTEKLFVQQLFFGTEPIAVYLSEKGVKLHKYFVDNRERLLNLGASLVVKFHANTLKNYAIKPVRAHAISKWLYHPIMACEILTNTLNIELLSNIKNCTFRAHDKYDMKATIIKPLTIEVNKFNEVATALDQDKLTKEIDLVTEEIIKLVECEG